MTPTEWINAQRDELVQRVAAWSNINSGSRNVSGLNLAAKTIYDAYLAIEPEYSEIIRLKAADDGPALVFRKRAQAAQQLLLFGHLDTVYGPEHPLQRAGAGIDGRIGGPGVCDMKGGLAILL
jgi:glutamate carboxypeptidase